MTELKTDGMTALGFALLALTYPILIVGPTHLLWQFSFVALIVLTVTLAGILLHWHTTWFSVAGLIIAIAAATSHWFLLPLLLAQVGLATIIATQRLSPPVKTAGVLIVAGFVQTAIVMNQTALIDRTFLIDLGLQLAPFVIVLAAQHLPIWGLGLLELAVIAAGYFLQRFTIITAVACIVLTLLPALIKRLPVAYYPLAATVLGVTLHLSMMHG